MFLYFIIFPFFQCICLIRRLLKVHRAHLSTYLQNFRLNWKVIIKLLSWNINIPGWYINFLKPHPDYVQQCNMKEFIIVCLIKQPTLDSGKIDIRLVVFCAILYNVHYEWIVLIRVEDCFDILLVGPYNLGSWIPTDSSS